MPNAQSGVIFGYIEDEVVGSAGCAIVGSCHARLFGDFIEPVKPDLALILDRGRDAVFVDLVLHVGFVRLQDPCRNIVDFIGRDEEVERFVGNGVGEYGDLLSMGSITTKRGQGDSPCPLFELEPDCLLILEEDVHCCQPAADTEGEYENDKVIDDDALRVGFASLAVVLRVAILAFDVVKHFGSDGAAPPGVVDWFGVGLSALRAGGVLGWGLHKVPPKVDRLLLS